MSEAKQHPPGGYRDVFQVAWPLIISMSSFTLMQFVDRIFLAWHSPVSIQAALPAGLLSFTLVSCFMALAGYANTFVANYHGAGEKHGCARATVQGVWLSVLVWPLLLLMIPLGRWILHLSGHEPAVLAEELVYFKFLMAGSVSIPLAAAISSFFTGRGDTVTNMGASVAGNVINIALDYVLIFGKFGFPQMGIAGAAVATVVAGFVTPAILFWIYLSRANDADYGTRRYWRIEKELMVRIIRFGFPSGLQLFLDVSSFSVFVLLTGRMGEMALAVSNIAFSVNTVAFMPLLGISMAASILVGQYQGRRDSATAERAGWTALKIGVIYMSVIALTYLLVPQLYFILFTEDGHSSSGLKLEEILPLGRKLLQLMALWGLLDAINVILSGALKGAGDTRFVMTYAALMHWLLLVPVQWFIVVTISGGILLSWAWLAAFIWLLSAGFFLRFRSGKWKDIRVLDHPNPPIQPRGPGADAFAVVE